MDEPFYFYLVVTFVVIDIVITIFVVRYLRKKSAEGIDPKLVAFAEELGLELCGGERRFPDIKWLGFLRKPYFMQGQYSGMPVRVINHVVGHGKSAQQYSAVRFDLPSTCKLELKLSKGDFFSKMGTAIGMQDLLTGDARFDDYFLIKGNDENFVTIGLLPEFRERLLEVWERGSVRGMIQTVDGSLSYDELGSIQRESNQKNIKVMLPLIKELADLIIVYSEAS